MAKAGRIERKFEELRARGEAALVPFIVAGDPDLKHTGMLVMEMEARGADIIELGVPFSDPMADGPANQRALARGLAAGASVSAILGLVGELRKQTQIPIILFGYFNPFFRYGCERLCADGAQAGLDGLLVVDMPPEESRELAKPARAAGIDLIYLLAPTTPLERSPHHRALRQRVSLLRVGDRSDRGPHPGGFRRGAACARTDHDYRPADRGRLRNLHPGAGARGRRLRRCGGGWQRAIAVNRGARQNRSVAAGRRRPGGIDEGGDAGRARRNGKRGLSVNSMPNSIATPRPETPQASPPEDLWVKCPGCKEIAFRKEVERNLNVCLKCGYHFRLTVEQRLSITADRGTWRKLTPD